MSRKQDSLVRLTRELIDCTEQLRAALLEYRRTCEKLVEIAEAPPARSTVERLERVKLGEKRERVTSAITAFEAARRKARIGLLAVAEEEGSNLSEVARTLGVSRQLASRLAMEASGHDR